VNVFEQVHSTKQLQRHYKCVTVSQPHVRWSTHFISGLAWW